MNFEDGCYLKASFFERCISTAGCNNVKSCFAEFFGDRNNGRFVAIVDGDEDCARKR